MLNLSPFPLRSISDARTLTMMALRNGVTLEGLDTLLKEYMVNKEVDIPRRVLREKDKKRLEKSVYRNFTRCPICQQKAEVLPVNNTPSTMVGGNYKSAWICHNRDCMHTEYSEMLPAQIFNNK